MDTDQVLKFIGEMVAYGGGSAIIAYLIFQYLGKNWIENKFAERLEQLRHDQAQELAEFKVITDSRLNASIKLQEKEFQVLSEVWERLNNAHALISKLVSAFQQYPDIKRMTEIQLDEFFEGTKFTQSQKDEIKNSSDRNATYQEIAFWYHLHDAKKAFVELNGYVRRNGIFLQSDLKEKLSIMAEKLWSALVSKEVGHDAKNWKMQTEGWKTIKNEIEPLYQDLEESIHKHLRSFAHKPYDK